MSDAHSPQSSVKDTLVSLTIAFALAFVFRGFVIEGFVIPTGSMAPTLNGAHVRMYSPESGDNWAVDPWDPANGGTPLAVQGRPGEELRVTDPMTGAKAGRELPADMGENRALRGGERIFVLKYLFSIFDPSRFDPVVFKYPGNPRENYIKRLVGLPNEEIALVDGDIFARPAHDLEGGVSDWSADDWTVVRKPEREQRTLWMAMADSRYEPIDPERDGRVWFRRPWSGQRTDGSRDARWTFEPGTYRFEGSGDTALVWDTENWPVTDRYWYNESPDSRDQTPMGGMFPKGKVARVFPVSDVRVSFNIEPDTDGAATSATLTSRGHEFRASVSAGAVKAEMRSTNGSEWNTLDEVSAAGVLGAGRITRVEFWFVDQSVQVWINGKRVANGAYDWTPAQRVAFATDLDPDSLDATSLADWSHYTRPSIRVELDGGSASVHRLRLDRDLHYQASVYPQSGPRYGEPALATHPATPCVLGPDQFFMCGDNSASSLDGRLWQVPDPAVAAQLDPTPGVVDRALMVGRAFVVYFPGINRDRGYPAPDAGRLRWIW